MDKRAIAQVLEEIGTLLELRGENPFRARAFFTAARTVEGLEGDVAELAASGALSGLRGLGPATVQIVEELLRTGAAGMHHELRAETPDGLLELLRIPGLGARRVHTLHKALGVESVEELEHAAREGRIAELPGFGARTQEKLLEGIGFLRSVSGRRRQPEADGVAEAVTELLAAQPAVQRVEVAGALRRRLETVDGIELVAAVADHAAPVLDALRELPGVTGGERVGEAAAVARLADGLTLSLRCVAPDGFAAAWLNATGSDAHLDALAARAAAAGLRLNEFGLWRGAARQSAEDEAAVYRRLGLDYVPPELREDGSEIEAAMAGGLPELVEEAGLRGCFHCHTTYSDGHHGVHEMAAAARGRGWRYLGIADHSMVAAYAGGLAPADIERQHAEIDAWNAEHGGDLWLFKGIEADILPDGRLDYSDLEDDVLARFDYVVGSVHSSFGMSQAEMTRRVLRALENPHLTFLGHPTGRILLGRTGYAIDLDAVIDAAAERGVGIEINANPRRLDMDWRHWRRAREKGVIAAINPDAHSVEGLYDVHWGVMVARKGWLTAADVVNAWELDRVGTYFREARRS